MSFTEFPIDSVELSSVAANARNAISAMENTNAALNALIEDDLPATITSLDATDGGNAQADAGKLAKFDTNGALAIAQSINRSTFSGSVLDTDSFGINKSAEPVSNKRTTALVLFNYIKDKLIGLDLTFNGLNTFVEDTTFENDVQIAGQVEMTGQALTSGDSALTRDLADTRYDERYGQVFSSVSIPAVQAASTTPVTVVSLTLPNGTYHIDSSISTLNGAVGGVSFGINADKNIRIGLLSQFGRDLSSFISRPIGSSQTTGLEIIGDTGGSNFTSRLSGILQVYQGNTTVNLTVAQAFADPTPVTTRQRAYFIAKALPSV